MSSIKLNPAPGQLPQINKQVDKKDDLPAMDKRDPRMLEAAKSFENQFIRQMISEMRKTIPKDELVGESMADDIFRGQLDDQYADMWTNQGGIGLADLIYQQMYEKYGPQTKPPHKPSGEFLNLPADKKAGVAAPRAAGPQAQSRPQRPTDILAEADKNLFLMKRTSTGFSIKSREPLPETVSLRAPLSGVVLQAAALDDGRQMVVLRHDQGLVSRFVHTGDNHVKNNVRVAAGEIIAELPPSKKGEGANVVFELRQAVKTE